MGKLFAKHSLYGILKSDSKAGDNMNEELLEQLKAKVRKLPMQPGVYLMKDASGTIIYVGKAKLLKNRVSSYFRAIDKHLPKVYKMVQNVADFEYIVTDSEFEALVLECSLIKLHSPKYNILLKDDKGYSYIRISPGEYPRITAELQKNEDGATYLGPYTSSFVTGQTVDEANKAFMLPTCNRKFPQDFRKERPCLNYHLKQCMGVCQGKISVEEYREVLDQAIAFIHQGSGAIIGVLENKMNEYAENLEFEKAARYRDRINAIKRISQRQKVVFSRVDTQDVLGFVQGEEDTACSLLRFRGGRLVDKEDFLLGEVSDLKEARSEFLARYYQLPDKIPPVIAIDGEFEDPGLISGLLSERLGKKVHISIPQRGDQHKLVQMALTNCAQKLSHQSRRSGREIAALDELAKLLGLPKPPTYIEAYDISNIGSETVVAGMVVFQDGRPLKSAYKKFQIKTVEGTDDYASMREVIGRRLNRYEEESPAESGFGRLPDLILLDGGQGHVNTVLPVIASFGLEIPVFGMVKDDRHRTRAISSDGGEISISALRSVYTLISSIQEEVHRFAIGYSRSKHRKGAFESTLTTIEGVGPTRAKMLFREFKSTKGISQASVERLQAVRGMNRQAAENVYRFYHPEVEADGEQKNAKDLTQG